MYSDIDLVSTNNLYAAHRAVVCSWSPVICQACEFNAANLDQAELKLNEFDSGTAKASFHFGDADPQAVDCVVQFFYLWDYNIASPVSNDMAEKGVPHADDSPAAEETATSDSSHLILHSKVFTLAHIYDIPRLGDLSVKKFQAVARSQWRSNCLLDAAREAYTATPSAASKMREAIVKTFYEHRELLDEDYVKEFLLEMPHLTLDILMYVNKPPPTLGFGASRWPA